VGAVLWSALRGLPSPAKRAFGADGPSDSVGTYRTLVNPPRDPVIIRPSFPKIGVHELERLIAHIHAGEDAKAMHLRTGRRSDSMEFADWAILNEARPHLWRDHELSVGLPLVGRKFCQELIVRDAGRRGQACLAQDLDSNQGRDLCRDWEALDVLGDI